MGIAVLAHRRKHADNPNIDDDTFNGASQKQGGKVGVDMYPNPLYAGPSEGVDLISNALYDGVRSSPGAFCPAVSTEHHMRGYDSNCDAQYVVCECGVEFLPKWSQKGTSG